MTQEVSSFVALKSTKFGLLIKYCVVLNKMQKFQTQWEVIVSYLFQLTMRHLQPTQAIIIEPENEMTVSKV